MIRRALITAAVAVGVIASGTGAASAAPVHDGPAPYCGPGYRLDGARCEVNRVYIDTEESSVGEWAVGILGVIVLFTLA